MTDIFIKGNRHLKELKIYGKERRIIFQGKSLYLDEQLYNNNSFILIGNSF